MAEDTPHRIQTIRVGEDWMPWHPGLDVAVVVATRGADPQGVATALNGRFVPRALRDRTPVQPGDHVLLFQPIVGG